MGNKKLFIIDAMAMAFRNYHAFGVRQLTNSNGLPTSAVFGTAQFMNRLIENEAPDYILVATESGGKNFRHRLYPEYKANRKEMPDDLRIQLPWFFRLLESMGCRIITPEDHEADDVVGSAVKRYAGGDTDCYIVSGDKDFMQLINERVFLYTPRKGGEVKVIDDQGVEEKFGCSPQQVIDILSLMGDSSDNVPGVPGIGEKGASKLIQQYGSLEGIYDHLDEIKNKRQKQNLIEHRDLAFLSRDLVTIHTDLDLPSDKEAFAFRADEALAGRALLDIYEELEFVDLARKTLQRMGRQDAPGESRPAESGEEPNADAEAEPAPAVETDYQLVDNRRALQQLVPLLSGAEWYAFDTETTGLSVVSDRPVGLSFSVAPGQAFYVPLLEKHLGDDLRPDDVLAALAPVLKSKAAKVGHNCKFDIQMLRNAGLDVTGPFLDTMVASHLINPTTRGHGLDACCLRWLDYKKIPTEELIGKKAEIAMADVDLPLLTRYACEDADLTGRLYQRLEKELTQLDLMTVYKEIEMPLVPVLAGMEQEGIYIKVPELSHLSEKMAKRLEALTATIHELAGEEFNINSTKQLQVILFEKLRIHEELGIKRLKKTKSGFSTDFSVLQQLAAHPLPAALLEYRQISKLKSTYVDTLPELVHPDTGRIHTSYHQTGTATGRLSSSDPNLQNIPVRTAEGQEIRHAFQAADQQHVLLSADYSQIELRLLAHMAREENLTAAFRAGDDGQLGTSDDQSFDSLESIDDVKYVGSKTLAQLRAES